MDDRISRLEKQVAELALRLEAIERQGRPDTLPHSEQVPVAETVPETHDRASGELPGMRLGISPTILVSLIGRTLVILGGGFLLRAITEGGILTRPVGTAVGLVYGVLWILLGDREAGRQRGPSALFFAMTGLMIVFPILIEAATTYAFLSPRTCLIGATAVGLLVLAVGWHRRMRLVAWMGVLGTLPVGVFLAWKAGSPVPWAFSLNVLGLATVWVGYSRRWLPLAWFTALAVDLGILTVLVLFLGTPDAQARFDLGPLQVIVIQFSAVLIYLGSIGARTLIRQRNVLPFEIFQTLTLLALWLGGALKVSGSKGVELTPLGLGCLLLAAFSYGVTFTVIDRQVGGRRNFIFYATLALVFAVFGGAVLLGPATRVPMFAALGLVVTWFGVRYERVTLIGHSVFYLAAAALWSGLLAAGGRALVGSGGPPAEWLEPSVLGVIVALLLIAAAPTVDQGRTWGRTSRVPRVLLFALLAFAIDGLSISGLARVFTGPEGGSGDPAALAAIRTAVLALTAFGAGRLGRFPRWADATWLVYPLLALGGLKLVIEDLRVGRPLTLFVSLAVYGGVLVLAPRLLRRPLPTHR